MCINLFITMIRRIFFPAFCRWTLSMGSHGTLPYQFFPKYHNQHIRTNYTEFMMTFIHTWWAFGTLLIERCAVIAGLRADVNGVDLDPHDVTVADYLPVLWWGLVWRGWSHEARLQGPGSVHLLHSKVTILHHHHLVLSLLKVFTEVIFKVITKVIVKVV